MAMIIRTNRELRERYHELQSGDCFVGMLGFKPMRHAVVVDLLARGIRIVPSPLCQILNSSKAAQAQVMGPWMLPQTCVVTRRTDLMGAVNRYNRSGVGAVVTKEDGLDCGYGIHRWHDIEEVYNYAAFNSHVYPFVLQPFLRACSDIRVIIAGDHCEAYSRENPHNFRMNLTAGGKSRPYTLSGDQLVLCRQIMERGRFPYAHIDILVGEDGRNYLSEIALNGGMKGARISREGLDAIKADILENLVPRSQWGETGRRTVDP